MVDQYSNHTIVGNENVWTLKNGDSIIVAGEIEISFRNNELCFDAGIYTLMSGDETSKDKNFMLWYCDGTNSVTIHIVNFDPEYTVEICTQHSIEEYKSDCV